MSDIGSIALADIGREQRHIVIVLSSQRFARASRRVVIVPEVPAADPDEPVLPWRIVVGARTFGVDHIQSIRAERVLETVGHVPAPILARIRSAVRQIA